MLQHYINHISLVVDASGSMQGQPVVKVFDKELEYLKQRSIELNQETRISIYLFSDGQIECLTFDMDVMRFKSLSGFWQARGGTPLLDAVGQSVLDNQKLPELYGDHAFLQYVITDGMENQSRKYNTQSLKKLLDSLPDNWTTAILVPDQRSKFEAKKFGFGEDAIAIWDTTKSNAFEGVGTQSRSAVDQYMVNRSQGVRGTKTFFAKLDTSNLTKSALEEVDPRAYSVYKVDRETPIRPFVELVTSKEYKLGTAYYQPVKTVEIQDYKDIYVQDVRSGKLYTGQNIRQLLGLPANTAEVDPGNHKDWRVFVQSTSVNRKLFPNTHVMVKEK